MNWLWLAGAGGAAVGMLAGNAWAAAKAETRRRRDLAAAAQANEAKIDALIEHLPLECWAMDADRRYTLVNSHSRIYWGITREVIGKRLDEIKQPPELLARWHEHHERAFRGEVVRDEFPHLHNGSTRHYFSIVAPLYSAGRITGLVGVTVDISDRVTAEQRRRESEHRLAQHLRQAPLAVAEWNVHGCVTGWNPAAETVFGYSLAEAKGKPAGLILVDDDVASFDRMWKSLSEHGQSTRATFHCRTKARRLVVCEWFCAPLQDGAGNVTGAVSFVQDITDRVALEAQTQRAKQLQSVARLAAGVAHEFNNLLAPMLIEAERIGTSVSDQPRVHEHVRALRSAIDRARDFTNRTQLVAADYGGAREWTQLPDLLPKVLDGWRLALDPRVELAYVPRHDLPSLSMVRSAIEQVVLGLLANAQEALVEKLSSGAAPVDWKPRITVSLDLIERNADHSGYRRYQAITIADNGPGLAAEQQARLFEPLFTTKTRGCGRGLGLAIVRNLVTGHDGVVEFTSEEGHGATVRVCFPTTAVETTFLPPPSVWLPPIEEPAGKRSILLVEDNLLVAEALAGLLRDVGHRVRCAGDGQEAWALLEGKTAEFDLIITDLNMPGMSGSELLERIRAAELPQPVLLITGYADSAEAEEFLRLGAVAVIKKPVHPTELLNHVAQACARK
jgi:two-component system cell cycle sensor histidine kinase/response regulator CckA